MSLRKLVEGDCGGVNPLMQLGGQFARDAAHKDEGLARSLQQDEQLVQEFLGQVAAPPTSFHMDTLLQEMREIEQAATPHFQAGPRVIDEVSGASWAQQFHPSSQIVHVKPQQQPLIQVPEFFDEPQDLLRPQFQAPMPRYMPQLAIMPATQQEMQMSGVKFFEEAEQQLGVSMQQAEDEPKIASDYNEQFWQRLQNEWAKMSQDAEQPWLAEYDDNYDPYKEYEFSKDNPMANLENCYERGKQYLEQGDIPSAVLCFEAAAQQQPDNMEIWEILGNSQAENEMDPQAIAALKRALKLQPQNERVLMALAVCYTNENLQNQALNMLLQWLDVQAPYKHLIDQQPGLRESFAGPLVGSLMPSHSLRSMQELFLSAVRANPTQVDAKVQEALGVLYNLSSDFDKAADCFRAALSVDALNAKVWNRLGASLANGSRSVEAVEAYQQALALQPGFIRVRYNVGVCCMNLKAYTQAVEHLLTALNMQANAAAGKELPSQQQQMSESIWSTLKMVISLLGRNELQGLASERNLTALNSAFNI